MIGLVGYLMVTGMRESIVYYHTPNELMAEVAADPGYHDLGVKVGGRVLPGSVVYDQRTLDLSFQMVDIDSGETVFPVKFQGPLPETFTEGVDVVVEGQYTRDGVFLATNVITKCGSRYEAAPEDYLTEDYAT
jgi:cytochrome c-type biogenesis protein CcmE